MDINASGCNLKFVKTVPDKSFDIVELVMFFDV